MLIIDDFFSCLTNLIEHLLFERIVPQEVTEIVDLPTVDHYHRVFRLIVLINRHFSYLFYNFHPVNNLPKHHTFPIEMRTGFQGYVKLRCVGISATIGH